MRLARGPLPDEAHSVLIADRVLVVNERLVGSDAARHIEQAIGRPRPSPDCQPDVNWPARGA